MDEEKKARRAEQLRRASLRYAHSEKGKIARARYDASPTRQQSRARHEAFRGYSRKRLQTLARQRDSIVRQLEELGA